MVGGGGFMEVYTSSPNLGEGGGGGGRILNWLFLVGAGRSSHEIPLFGNRMKHPFECLA